MEFAVVGAEGVWGGGAFVGERGEEVFGELGEFGFGAHGFCSRGAAGAGMVGAMDGFEMAEGEMGVDLGGRDVGVAEEDLHAAEIGAVLDHVGGAAVAELVGAGGRVAGFDEMPYPLARQLLSAFGEE